jgi:hypothetical protein
VYLLLDCPSGLDGAAEADAGGGHRRQEGAGTRTLRQVPLLIQTDKYAHQYMTQPDAEYSILTSINAHVYHSDGKWHSYHSFVSILRICRFIVGAVRML